MNFKIVTTVLFLLTGFIMSGCQSTQGIQEIEPWVITDLQKRVILKLSDQKQIDDLKKVWIEKKEVHPKKMPDFNFEVHITKNGSLEQWMCSDTGFLKLKNGSDGKIYRADLSSINHAIRKKR
ncbi:MAG: hypothetical protein ACPGJI_04845 [Kangiellaceae bacterium]